MGLKCEVCGKSAFVSQTVRDIEGKKHTLCLKCGKLVVDGEKAVKYDAVNHKLMLVDPEDAEVRKKCEVCGHIFCYNPDDIAKNKQHATDAALSALSGLSGAFGGNYTMSAVNAGNTNDSLDRIVDYNKCPKCGSRSLRELTKEEFQQEIQAAKAQQAPAAPVSAADELKKFKELLDSGVITQEEFDAKKKQLLGL